MATQSDYKYWKALNSEFKKKNNIGHGNDLIDLEPQTQDAAEFLDEHEITWNIWSSTLTEMYAIWKEKKYATNIQLNPCNTSTDRYQRDGDYFKVTETGRYHNERFHYVFVPENLKSTIGNGQVIRHGKLIALLNK